MIVDTVIRDVVMSTQNIIRALASNLTARDNFAPDGVAGQVLTSNGLGVPPSFQNLPASGGGSSVIDAYTRAETDNLFDALAFSDIDGQIADAQVPASAVTQHQAALSIAWSQITGTPATIAGYGITDVYTKAEVDALVPLTTNGDLLTRVAGINARLGIGSAGQVLTVVSGAPAWAATSGGISGLTTGYVPYASSPTTLADSPVSIDGVKAVLHAATAAKASLSVPVGVAPSIPTDGDLWYDGTDLLFRVGSLNKILSVFYKLADPGLRLVTMTGTSYDFEMTNPAGTIAILRVPTGTGDVLVPSGSIDVNTAILVGATQVVSSRKTGWTAWAGTATRNAQNTATATTQQCAEAIKALIDDLISHGLIGA